MARPHEDTLAQRLLAAREARRLTQGKLAKQAGMKQPDISKIERGLILKTTGIGRLAKALRVPVGWLESGEGPRPNFDEAQAPAIGGAQSGVPLALLMSQYEPMMNPITIKWDTLMSCDLPPIFKVVIEDDAMAPEFPRGCVVTFSTGEGAPRAEDAVLVSDAEGNVYFREYQEYKPGHWKAVALARGRLPLDSKDDGLKVLAISMGKWGRRGPG